MGAADVDDNLGGRFGCSPPSSRLTFSQMMFQPNIMDRDVPGELHLADMAVHHDQTTSEGEIPEFESTKSGSDNQDGASGEEQDPKQPPNKKRKRYHRHTQHQIQELESFFKECPHPDDKQRKVLSRDLGLEPMQVKFWFQNKRTQMKMQHERSENSQLRAENEKLHMENIRYREALSNASCPNCGGPVAVGDMPLDEHHLWIENARLREEINRLSAIAARYVGTSVVNYPPMSPQTPPELGVGNYSGQTSAGEEIYIPTEDLSKSFPPTDIDKPAIIEMAAAAMQELMSMAQMNEPLWMTSIDGTNILNEEEYGRMYPRITGQGDLKSEASKDNAIVNLNHINLVEILMDVDQWSTIFSGIVSSATTLEVLSTEVAGQYNGALQVMNAEYQVPSPHVPTRESYFVRYCKQHPDGTWAVVDVSLDSLRTSPAMRCRKRPSGCIIKELSDGCSKVTWVEHVEVDDIGVSNLYKPLIDSGLAFSAKRWVATLERQSDRLASMMATSIPIGGGVITTAEGRKGLLNLGQRMVMSFFTGVSASTAHTWTTVSGNGVDDVRIMTRKSIGDPGRPPGIVLSAAASFWVPVPHKQVFDFLRDVTTRKHWDILSSGGFVQEIGHIANGGNPGNSVSLLRVNSEDPNQRNMLILQERFTDATGSFIIYAPVDFAAINNLLKGGDPNFVALLPSGCAILPDGLTKTSAREGSASSDDDAAADHGQGDQGGSLVSIAFQILVDSVPSARLSPGSVATVNSLIACTIRKIKGGVVGEDVT